MNGKNFVVYRMQYPNMQLLHQVNQLICYSSCLRIVFELGASIIYLCGGDFPNGMFDLGEKYSIEIVNV